MNQPSAQSLNLETADVDRIQKTGFHVDAHQRSGSFLAEDQLVKQASSMSDGVDILSISEAMEKYPDIQEKMWSLVSRDKDSITQLVYEYEQQNQPTGVFIRVKAGTKVTFPLQSCYLLKTESSAQKIHNILMAEEDSEIHIITGCTTGSYVVDGQHYGITEFFVGRNAILTYTMIHQWAPEMEVLPRSAAMIEEGGLFLSNYISLDQVKYIQSYPTAHLKGKGAKARFYSVVLAPENSHLDLGARGVLSAPQTAVEIISQTVSTGGKVYNRGHIIGEGEDAYGHMECNGLIVDKGIVHAVPELEARIENISLTHEASVGRLSQEEVNYLRTRGLTENQARELILTGFLKVQMLGIPKEMQQSIDKMIEMTAKSSI